jgi:hypothetical protein
LATTGLAVQTGLLAVSKNSGYANTSVTPNTAGAKIASFTLQNQSTSEPIRVTSLAIALKDNAGAAMTTSSTPALTNFSNLRTSETSGSGATPVQPAATNTFSVDFTIAPGATKTIDVYADTGATTSTSLSTTLATTSLGTASNVAVLQNTNGTAVAGQTITLASGTITNPPTLLTANSTASQFVPAGNGGATDASKATFNIKATGGAATISELKFTVNSQDKSAASVDASGTSTGSQVITLTTSSDAASFQVGDVVEFVAATTNGRGVVTAIAAPDLTVNVTVAYVGALSAVRLTPATVTSVRVGSMTAPVVSGVAYLTGLSLAVPNGGSGLTQDVFVSYSPVGTNGMNTGATSRLALEYIKYTGGSSTATISTTALGGSGLTAVVAPTMKLVGSRPALTVNSASSTLIVGTTEVGSVTVTANAKGDITLNTLPISVALSGATMPNAAPGYAADGLIVKDANGQTITTTNTAFSATTAGGTSTITFTNGYPITAGTSATFRIFITTNAVSNPNGAHTSSATLTLGAASSLSWTDTSGNASAATATDVAGSAAYTTSNTTYLYNYPTNTVSVSS